MKEKPDIKTGWESFDLHGYRPHPSQPATYSFFSYEDLPPIPGDLADDFAWLRAAPAHSMGLRVGDYGSDSKSEWSKFDDVAAQMDVPLPESFTTFIWSSDLHARIRSCTDCYIELPERPVRIVGKHRGFLIHFLSDQQWCVHWYLVVDYAGNHFVAMSGDAYGFSASADDDSVCHKSEIELDQEDIYFCAPTFVEFIYRFWLENEIWFALAWNKEPLSDVQQAYVNHYLRLGQANT